MTRVWLTVLALALFLGPRAIGQSNPPLPTGPGLSARYPGDVGIASDPAVILADDFESYSSPSGLTSRWTQAPSGSNVRLATEAGNVFAGTKALEFTIPQTSTETGLSIAKFPLNPERDVLFVRAHAKYSDTFNVLGSSHNGIIIQAHYCCPGVPADGTNKFFTSYEAARFETTVPNPGQLALYIYHPLQRDLFGDHFFPTGVVSPFTSTLFDFGPQFVSRPNVVPTRGLWYSYELMVKANTPGLKDGRIAMWLNGNLIADFMNLRLRDVTSLKIDRFSLDLHVKTNTLGVVKKWYDNIVAATSYIGPMVPVGAIPTAPKNLRITRQ